MPPPACNIHRPLSLAMEVESACSSRLYQVWSSYRRHTFGFSINRPGARYCPYRLPILVFLWLFVLDLWTNTCQMDHVTLRPWLLTLEVMALVSDTGLRAIVLHLCSHSEDIWHTFDGSINRPGDLDLDLWPWNCALYCTWGGQPSYQFWVRYYSVTAIQNSLFFPSSCRDHCSIHDNILY